VTGLEGATAPLADTVPRPFPSLFEMIEQLRALGYSDHEMKVYADIRFEVDALPERLAKAVN
jgi:hypothetical protein